MTDYFLDLLPHALHYGMSIKEFWEEDPDLFWAYRFSYVEKIKEQQAMQNTGAWIQGAYFYEAVSVSLSNAFGKGRRITYRDKPYELNGSSMKTTSSTNGEPKLSKLDEQLKARALKIEKILGGATK